MPIITRQLADKKIALIPNKVRSRFIKIATNWYPVKKRKVKQK